MKMWMQFTAPQYLADGLQRVANISSRTRLRRRRYFTFQSKHKTIGDQAFPVAAVKVWNSLSPLITSFLQITTELKTVPGQFSKVGNTNPRTMIIIETSCAKLLLSLWPLPVRKKKRQEDN